MKLESLDLQIIDTHTHFYDPTRPQGVPWPNQDDNFLYKRVMPENYKSLAVSQGVKGTVCYHQGKSSFWDLITSVVASIIRYTDFIN